MCDDPILGDLQHVALIGCHVPVATKDFTLHENLQEMLVEWAVGDVAQRTLHTGVALGKVRVVARLCIQKNELVGMCVPAQLVDLGVHANILHVDGKLRVGRDPIPLRRDGQG